MLLDLSYAQLVHVNLHTVQYTTQSIKQLLHITDL